ncbi:unnamed protein product [Miscanthus lutarioriparius]|uniref:Uncharacterized protein n=1 Tax=Miscanthus lutarioriparius TaxID=422564 RepID=A0A811PQT9_9POAL|nr:unnamed protein product [Miscanthus lutarioriparius]
MGNGAWRRGEGDIDVTSMDEAVERCGMSWTRRCAPTHVVFKEEGVITTVDSNVGKSDRSEMKVTGKRKRNAQHLQENSALCKVCVNDKSFIVRLVPLILKITEADSEGYIAIFQPKPADWLKIKDKFLSYED